MYNAYMKRISVLFQKHPKALSHFGVCPVRWVKGFIWQLNKRSIRYFPWDIGKTVSMQDRCAMTSPSERAIKLKFRKAAWQLQCAMTVSGHNDTSVQPQTSQWGRPQENPAGADDSWERLPSLCLKDRFLQLKPIKGPRMPKALFMCQNPGVGI